MPTLPRKAVRLGWGKIRRWILIALRPRATAESLSRRRGQCNRCGTSCKLLFRCPAFDDSDGQPKCRIYNDRPGVCGLFPLDEKDLRDRDLVNPAQPCGYTFVKERSPVRPEDLRLLNGRRFSFRGTVGIVRFFLKGGRRANGLRSRDNGSYPPGRERVQLLESRTPGR